MSLGDAHDQVAVQGRWGKRNMMAKIRTTICRLVVTLGRSGLVPEDPCAPFHWRPAPAVMSMFEEP